MLRARCPPGLRETPDIRSPPGLREPPGTLQAA